MGVITVSTENVVSIFNGQEQHGYEIHMFLVKNLVYGTPPGTESTTVAGRQIPVRLNAESTIDVMYCFE
jgi:hypothetical protein